MHMRGRPALRRLFPRSTTCGVEGFRLICPVSFRASFRRKGLCGQLSHVPRNLFVVASRILTSCDDEQRLAHLGVLRLEPVNLTFIVFDNLHNVVYISVRVGEIASLDKAVTRFHRIGFGTHFRVSFRHFSIPGMAVSRVKATLAKQDARKTIDHFAPPTSSVTLVPASLHISLNVSKDTTISKSRVK